MQVPTPPALDLARRQLEGALNSVEKKTVDLIATPWPEIEKMVIKVLGGPYQPSEPTHQVVALGLSAAFGARLIAEFPAFWFPTRDAPEGAALGFSEALIMLSPFGAVSDALASAKLETLDDVVRSIRTSLGQAKFGAPAMGRPMKLSPDDYMRLFDPGFVRFVSVDRTKIDQAWAMTPERLSAEFRDAVSRTGSRLPEQLKKQVESQILSALSRLQPGKPLAEQLVSAPRVAELIAMLWGTVQSTGSVAEEFWVDVGFPLLFIGAPEKFPALDEKELEAAKAGADPFLLLLELVPYQFKSPEEEGVLGAFPASGLKPLSAALAQVPGGRIIQVSLDAVAEPLKKFSPEATRDLVKRYYQHVRQAMGGQGPEAPSPGVQEMLDAAMVVLKDFQTMAASGKDIVLVNHTEAEAAAEQALTEVRASLQGPRIILA